MIILVIGIIFLVIIGIGVAFVVCGSGKLSRNEFGQELIQSKENHDSKKEK